MDTSHLIIPVCAFMQSCIKIEASRLCFETKPESLAIFYKKNITNMFGNLTNLLRKPSQLFTKP